MWFLNIGAPLPFPARKTIQGNKSLTVKKTTFAINASICPMYLSFRKVYRARHTTHTHPDVCVRGKVEGRTQFPSAVTSKRELLSRFYGHLARKETAKRITVEYYHVRNRAIASTNFEILATLALTERPLLSLRNYLASHVGSTPRAIVYPKRWRTKKKGNKTPIAPEEKPSPSCLN